MTGKFDTHHKIQKHWKIASDSFKNVRYDNGKNLHIFKQFNWKVPNFLESFELSLNFIAANRPIKMSADGHLTICMKRLTSSWKALAYKVECCVRAVLPKVQSNNTH